MNDFLSIASHELKTPVTVLLANTQLRLRRARQDTQMKGPAREIQMLETTERQIQRLNRLLNDLVDVTRIRANKLRLTSSPIDIAQLAADVIDEQRLAHPERALLFDQPSEPLVLEIDADRIGQVLTNYLTNALKYSEADQPVEVRLLHDAHQVRVEVHDHGQGIPAEQLPHIWELFYQVPGMTAHSGSVVGLGLGLHICKTIIEQHGGQVGADSEPGQGSTFWFTLPIEGIAQD
jgi:signal transduction histidine kinase